MVIGKSLDLRGLFAERSTQGRKPFTSVGGLGLKPRVTRGEGKQSLRNEQTGRTRTAAKGGEEEDYIPTHRDETAMDGAPEHC